MGIAIYHGATIIMTTILRWLALLLMLLIAFIVFLLTPLGLKFSAAIVSKNIPGQLEYKSISGLITGPITINDLNYKNGNINIYAKKLTWNWRLVPLLFKKIDIRTLEANKLVIIDKKASSFHKKSPSRGFATMLNQLEKNAQQNQQYLQKINLHLPFTVSLDQSTFNNVTFKKDGIPRIHASYIHMNAQLQNSQLSWNLQSQLTAPTPLMITAQADGKLKAFKFRIDASGNKTQLQLEGNGSSQRITFTNINGSLLNGTIKGTLAASWVPKTTWNANLTMRHLDLNELAKNLPRQFNLTLQSEGQWLTQQPHFTLNATMNTLKNHGKIFIKHHKKWLARWDINIKQLKEFTAQLSGALRSKGTFSGQLDRPTTTGTLNITHLYWKQFHLQALSSRWQLDLSHKTPSQFHLKANTFTWRNRQFRTLTINADGNLTHHIIKTNLQTKNGQINFALRGGWIKHLWQGRLTALSISSPSLNNWRLTQGNTLSINQQHFDLKKICLNSNRNEILCIKAHWRSQSPWQIIATGSHVKLSHFDQYLKNDIKMQANMDWTFNATGKTERVTQAKFSANFGKGKLSYTAGKNTFSTPFNGGQINIHLINGKFGGDTTISFPNKNYFKSVFSLPGYHGNGLPKLTQQISGVIHARLQNSSVLSAVIPEVIVPHGSLVADLKLGGTILHPRIYGNTLLEKGTVLIPFLNLSLHNVDVKVRAENKLVHFTAGATSKGRKITVSGVWNLAEYYLPITMHVTGNDLLVSNTAEYKLYASPDIDLTFVGKKVTLNGKVVIPKGEIKPQDFRNLVSLPTNEIKYIGTAPFMKESQWSMTSNLQLTIDKNVSVDTAGLVGKIHGKLHVTSQPHQTLLATGRVGILDGSYSTYGHTLIMTPNSFVQYTNAPINNPALSLSATRTINVTTLNSVAQLQQLTQNKVVVGVSLRGTFRQPKITLFSQPPNLSQADILSYLILGDAGTLNANKNHDNTNGHLALIMRALDAIKLGSEGLTKTGSIIQQIQKGLGFSELGFQTETTVDAIGNPIDQQTAFVIGKHLTRNIYLRYSQGFNGPGISNINQFTVQYLLGRHWTVQGTTSNSEGSGVDILYSIQK